MTRVLFVCGRNVDRSPTAEELFSKVDGWEVKSAGVSPGATNPLTKELIKWANVIFVMEFKHQQIVLKIDSTAWKKVDSLEIPDIYYKNQPELKQVLFERMKKILHT